MSLYSRGANIMRQAVGQFRELFISPDSEASSEFVNRRQTYALLWSYYTNSVFERLRSVASDQWVGYKLNYKLYTDTRSVYNPYHRLIEFYVSHVYPGVLSQDMRPLPDGIPLAIPFEEDTEPDLLSSIGQLMAWSNWQDNMSLLTRYAGATGNALIEIGDEVERGKVVMVVRYPGVIRDIVVDPLGDVKSYELEYRATDPEKKKEFTFAKIVTKDSIATYRDDKLWDYGVDLQSQGEPETENPYGFVPACLVRPMQVGGTWGAPLGFASLSKIDETNSLSSHLHDYLHKAFEGYNLISTAGDVVPAIAATKGQPRSSENFLLLKTQQGATTTSLLADLDIANSLEVIKSLLSEYERDNPEVVMYQELRKMQQVTGPGASKIMGDVYERVLKVSASMDTQLKKAIQMSVAIGGYRANLGSNGGWGRSLTPAQRKFLLFDLSSFERGELDMTINPRPLIPRDTQDALAEANARADYANKVSEKVDAVEGLRLLGYRSEDNKLNKPPTIEQILQREADIDSTENNEE